MTVELNANQRAIVEAGEDPLLVVAGPGAGKTTVLKERIERLLAGDSSAYSRVLAITFTNVAAEHLREKLQALPQDQVQRVDIGTFHAFAMRLLQQHGTHIGLSSGFSIATDQSDREELLSSAFRMIGAAESPDKSVLPLLARLYERCPNGAEIGNYVDTSVDTVQLEKLFEAYVKVSVEKGYIDFPLLVFLANRILSEYPAIARQVRKAYKYICVDEFQDTNDAQFRLLEAIASANPKGLLFLSDQDQVIYQWNGASPKRLSEAKDTFRMNLLILPTSFRCPNEIIVAANNLISHNAGRFVTPQFDSVVENGGAIALVEHGDERLEVDWLAKQLAALPAHELSETAVLSRTKKLLDLALKAAIAEGVPAAIPSPRFEFQSAPLVMLHSLLRIASRSDSARRVRQLASSYNSLRGASIDADTLLAEGAAEGYSPIEAFLKVVSKSEPSAEFVALAQYLRSDLIARKDFRGLSTLFFSWIESQDAMQNFAPLEDYSDEKDVWQNLERQHTGLTSERTTLDEFLRRMDLESKAPALPNCVRFMTVHGAKGLEYDRVFIIGAAEDQFPSFQSLRAGPGSELMQEERRSFFVAVTRTKRSLTLSYAKRYNGYQKARSRFISEMGL